MFVLLTVQTKKNKVIVVYSCTMLTPSFIKIRQLFQKLSAEARLTYPWGKAEVPKYLPPPTGRGWSLGGTRFLYNRVIFILNEI
jgi:hypothetical protein